MNMSDAIIAVLNFQAISYDFLLQKECKSLDKTSQVGFQCSKLCIKIS